MKIEKCPFCGGKAAVWDKSRYDTCVRCDGCNAQTDWLPTISEAIAAWNRRAQPSEKPLTLDELRQMDGEPVWVEDDEEETNNGWCIWSASHTQYWIDENKEIGNYGETWLAYRRKPEGSENDG